MCQLCGEKFLKHSDKALKILGGVGLFFSFTEVIIPISCMWTPISLKPEDSKITCSLSFL